MTLAYLNQFFIITFNIGIILLRSLEAVQICGSYDKWAELALTVQPPDKQTPLTMPSATEVLSVNILKQRSTTNQRLVNSPDT